MRHYRIELELGPGAQTLAGATSIRVASRVRGLESFRSWLTPSLAITSVEVDGRGVHWNRQGSAVDVELGRGFDVGELFNVAIAYAGTPGSSSWYTASQNGSPVVSTLSQPWFARDWWAVKDDNSDKATGDLLITVPDGLTVVANGVLVSVDTIDGDRRRFHWSTGYPTSPYLFSFSATDYTTFSETFFSGDTAMPVEFFIYPGSDTPANRNGWRRVLDMLATFEDLFGPYPFIEEKYAIYEFPFGGGMEHQTATGQGGRYAFAEALTAHELAHQWWGDLVTCATWHDVWLNEGFATYATALWYEFASGVQDADSGRAYLESRRPAELDGTVYVYDVTDPRRIFSGTYSYNKAAWVLHMMRGAVGDDAFFEILAAYRERHAYATATTADLQAVAEAIVGRELDWFFDRWIFDGGAPAYAFGWREHEVGGRRWLELSVEQVQEEATFTMPIQVAIEVSGESSTETVWNDSRVQHYLLPVAGPVSDVVLDPDSWLLTRSVTRSAFAAGPPRLVAVDPGPGATLPAGQPLDVRLTFHEDVVIAPTDLVLRRQGGAVLPVDVVYDRQNLTAAVSSRQPLAGGSYELVVAASIVDAESGLAFDGELDAAAALPSGDGVPGGAALIELKVGGARRVEGRRFPSGGSSLLSGGTPRPAPPVQ